MSDPTTRMLPATEQTPLRGPLRIAQVSPLYEACRHGCTAGPSESSRISPRSSSRRATMSRCSPAAIRRPRRDLVPVVPRALRLDPALRRSAPAPHPHARPGVSRRGRVRHHPLPHRLPRSSPRPAPSRRRRCSRCTDGSTSPTSRRSMQFPTCRSCRSAMRSAAHARAAWVATVHHGVPERELSVRPRRAATIFVPRAASRPEKRPDLAIAIAKRAGMPLRIAAKVDPADQAYFESEIEPLLDRPAGRVHRRDRRRGQERPCWAARSRCCFPSTGRSRSAS